MKEKNDISENSKHIAIQKNVLNGEISQLNLSNSLQFKKIKSSISKNSSNEKDNNIFTCDSENIDLKFYSSIAEYKLKKRQSFL